MSMKVYEGPATLVGTTGRELAVTLELDVRAEPVDVGGRLEPLRSWAGEGSLPVGEWDRPDHGEAVLRMPDGRQARVLITDVRLGADSKDQRVAFRIVGMGGPPPIDGAE
ncbi:hypothetical protein OG589_14625 [Sphaerisporangium sp. NBC_01403]|uniref:hypothetical protein n=1 Tax=Sphaerisporangium sp. NBC_01403 TaxID=2903599 RepID=UPI003249BB06